MTIKLKGNTYGKGRKLTQAQSAARSRRQMGHKWNLGVRPTPEWIANRVRSFMNNPNKRVGKFKRTPEHTAKVIASRRLNGNDRHPAEARAKMRAAWVIRKERNGGRPEKRRRRCKDGTTGGTNKKPIEDVWELLKNTYKPYPCGIVMHAVIDACLALRRDHGVRAAEIAEIIVSGDQLLLDRGGRTVTNERDAWVSIHHCASVSFLFGKAGLTEFSDEVVRDPAVAALRALTTVRLDSNSPKGAATATVRTLDGRTLEETVLQARGSTEQPLSDQELEAKVRELARHGAFSGRTDDVIAAAWELDALGTIHPLIAAARPG